VRVALVCPYAWDAAGGVQVHVGDLAAQLAGRGHDVVVLAPHDGGAGGRAAGTVVRVPYRGTVSPIAPSPLAVGRLKTTLARWRPDVVHVHEPLTPSTSMWATLAAEVPVVGTFHAYLDRSRLLEVAAPLVRRVAGRLAATIAVSDAAAGFVRRALPELEPVVIPNGVEVDAFADAAPAALPDGRRIAWTHRLDPQKGFGVALPAFAALLEDVPDAHLVVGGDGADRRLVGELGADVRARVTMLGSVPHERVAGVLRACEVAIAPATGQESFGIALVEAMAAGVPVVASDIPGYREVVRDRREGFLVPPGDAVALAAAIRSVLRDPALASRLAEGGRARAEAFAWPSVVDRLETVYREVGAATPPLR
jgi:phosphatidylinositol alpha-mannosyltransferase